MTVQSTLNAQQSDQNLEAIADYTLNDQIGSEEAYKTAHQVLIDTLGCGILALRYPECTKHLGPIVPGTVVPNGTRAKRLFRSYADERRTIRHYQLL